jgi:hypothetical protein
MLYVWGLVALVVVMLLARRVIASARAASVGGRIAVENRPAQTNFLFAVYFIPTTSDAPPPVIFDCPSDTVLAGWHKAAMPVIQRRTSEAALALPERVVVGAITTVRRSAPRGGAA